MSSFCRGLTIGAAGVGWGLVGADMIPLLPLDLPTTATNALLSVAICATARLMLWAHMRPLDDAYRRGVEVGRRQILRELNRAATVHPLRPSVGGVTEFNQNVLGPRRRLRPTVKT